MRIAGWSAIGLIALGTSPAFAFDCAKARTGVELAICGDSEALAANDRMETAYFALRDRLAEGGRKLLLDGQKAWLSYRNESCGVEPGCLSEQGTQRADALEKAPAGMAPLFLWQRSTGNGYAVKISGYRFVAPATAAEAAYDDWLEVRIDETPYGKAQEANDDAPEPYSRELDITLHRLTGRLLSAAAYTYDYSGGAHSNNWSTAINLDRADGLALGATGVFGSQAMATLNDDCARQIVAWHSDMYAELTHSEALARLEENFPGEIANHVGDMARWHFDEAGGVVRFDAYAIAPYAAGPSECKFGYEQLRGLAADPEIFADN